MIAEGVAASLAAGAPYPAVDVEHGSYAPAVPMTLTSGMSIGGAKPGLVGAGRRDLHDDRRRLRRNQRILDSAADDDPQVEIVAQNAMSPSALDSIALKSLTCSSAPSFVACRFRRGTARRASLYVSVAGRELGAGSGISGGSGQNDGGDGGSGGGLGLNGDGDDGDDGEGPGGGAAMGPPARRAAGPRRAETVGRGRRITWGRGRRERGGGTVNSNATLRRLRTARG